MTFYKHNIRQAPCEDVSFELDARLPILDQEVLYQEASSSCYHSIVIGHWLPVWWTMSKIRHIVMTRHREADVKYYMGCARERGARTDDTVTPGISVGLRNLRPSARTRPAKFVPIPFNRVYECALVWLAPAPLAPPAWLQCSIYERHWLRPGENSSRTTLTLLLLPAGVKCNCAESD